MAHQRGKTVFTLPRITLIPSNTSLPLISASRECSFLFNHVLPINKAQGQTFQKTEVGVDLSTPCFSHGMLYVTLSRVGSPSKLSVNTENGTTKNVVYPEALH